jgi:NDP-sugar pyrophosphorylase family protein
MKSVTLVILAGGRGSRIKNFTNLLPKPLIKFSKISLLRYIINNFSKYSIDKIYILCGYKGKLIHREFHKKIINLVEINCIIEKRPMGTGGSLYPLKQINKNDFILINGDTVFDIDFNKFIKSKNKKSIGSIALIKNKNYKSNKKLVGIGLNKKKDIIFKNNSKLMNGGIYYLNKRIFKYIKNINTYLYNDIIHKLINKSQSD